MNELVLAAPVSPLRQRLIDDMHVRRFSRETQRNYIRDVGRFATFLGRPPDTATAEDLRRFQVEQRDAGVPAPTMSSIVAALRFFFTNTLDRPDLARKLFRVSHPRKLPVVLSRTRLPLREGFRAPAGVRKSPRNEPAGSWRRAMGISVFDRCSGWRERLCGA